MRAFWWRYRPTWYSPTWYRTIGYSLHQVPPPPLPLPALRPCCAYWIAIHAHVPSGESQVNPSEGTRQRGIDNACTGHLAAVLCASRCTLGAVPKLLEFRRGRICTVLISGFNDTTPPPVRPADFLRMAALRRQPATATCCLLLRRATTNLLLYYCKVPGWSLGTNEAVRPLDKIVIMEVATYVALRT